MSKNYLKITPLQVSFNCFFLRFRSISLKVDLKKNNNLSLMHIMVTQGILLFISAVADFMFDWLTDGRSSIRAKLNRLINSVCFWLWSLTQKKKHGEYSVKVHNEKYSTLCMETVWKIQYTLVDANINWLTGWYYSPTFTRCYTFYMLYRKRQHIFSVLSFYKYY